ncbi:cytochrome P450-like protein [Leptotrombidium deliense]|uniref:Cytochrome P450-like protein n=1 Tax=Leptotrombidium deliense TaxID=299467 RepID=A0A443SHT6_9ACAR|nr:cytochrome P450-like protein [Leptotrombidium deliense]
MHCERVVRSTYFARFYSVYSSKCDKLQVKPFDAIPGPRPSIPFIGTSWQYFKHLGRYELFKMHEANVDKFRRYGPIVKEEFQWKKPVVIVFEPQDFETILRYQGKYPVRPPNEFVCKYRKDNADRYTTVGVSNLLGEEWHKIRRIIAPVLFKPLVQKCFSSQNKIAEDFTQYLWHIKDNDCVIENMIEATYRQAIESLSMFCLNSRMGCLSTEQLTLDGKKLTAALRNLFDSYQQLYYGLPVWKLLPALSKAYKQFANAENDIYDVTEKYVENAFRNFKAKEDQSCDNVLESLLSLQKLNETDIRITTIDFMAGGIKTMSTTLAFILYHLSTNETVQKRLQQELDNAFKDTNNLTLEKLDTLSYLKACVKEVFRLSSTIPSIVRILPEKVVLSGYEVPAGTPIICSFYVTCRLSQFFEDPLQFKPERWLRQHKKEIHPYAMLPFGYGTRQCLGKWFSELQLHIVTANLFYRYNIQSMNTKNLESIQSFIIVPKDNIKIKLSRRQISYDCK